MGSVVNENEEGSEHQNTENGFINSKNKLAFSQINQPHSYRRKSQLDEYIKRSMKRLDSIGDYRKLEGVYNFNFF